MLLDFSADLRIPDGKRWTPLHSLFERKSTIVDEGTVQGPSHDLSRLLLSMHSVDGNTRDAGGSTPIFDYILSFHMVAWEKDTSLTFAFF
ncbi:hypothetical protein S7711_11137 [Stachybotrys chartarum IBT 7711]|uniref:Uncharacterized protein n=1 Tax=Stachybotrys chartarum (strain CBS 109288 / IBT 7711) TaxID=1280523 RepID=A0A084BA17_STACB|nr:hypothetical protein S7711_11137 [Stachybotrys chartarum IBT 7711]KFA54239.1 hypothetical protein S40293_11243 [Stachybotrys chartarum IBT 40293]KFA71562.1 hypothetical protein S40288_11172 [Stachybotrys chartarum IBT 40288]